MDANEITLEDMSNYNNINKNYNCKPTSFRLGVVDPKDVLKTTINKW